MAAKDKPVKVAGTGQNAVVGAGGLGSFINQNVIVRTVTLYYTGKVVDVNADGIVLADAAWIADTGRWSDALNSGESALSEIEPHPDPVLVMRNVIVDVSPWRHALPRNRK